MKIKLVRRDPFGSKCAGKVMITAEGIKGRRGARFNFGWAETREDTSGQEVMAKMKIGKRMKKRIKRHGKAKVTVVPWDGFALSERFSER